MTSRSLIAIGVLFLFLAGRQWTTRPRQGETPEMPASMASIDDFTWLKSFGLGFLLSALNPKNLDLTIAAVVKITGAGLPSGEERTTTRS